MKISEFIVDLQRMLKEHGDLDVVVDVYTKNKLTSYEIEDYDIGHKLHLNVSI